jgi:hypothetical protein
MREIPPENLVDRSSELDEFSSMLRFENEARLLTVCDEQGTGKTELLRILEYNCKYRLQPRVSVSRVLLDDKEITDTFTFVKRIREQLHKSAFPRFDYYESARLNHYWAPFAPAVPGSPRGESKGPEDFPSSQQWASADQEPKAQQQCVQAFLEDLRDLADAQPITLLVDTFENHMQIPGLQTWIIDELVWPLCVDEDRPQKFVLVLAGRKLPNFPALLPEERAQLVASRNSLTWEDDHVRDFLALHGYGALPEEDVQFVCGRVQQGFSISRALKLAEALVPAGVG